MENTAVVIITFDGYKDVWPIFFKCFEMNWPENLCKVYFVNNEASVENKYVKTINTGIEISWSYRVRKAIEQIEEENLIILLEDYFIDKAVDAKELVKLTRLFSKKKYDYLRLIPIPKEHCKKKKGSMYKYFFIGFPNILRLSAQQ